MNLQRLRIIHYPDPRLKVPSVPVENIDKKLADLVDRMFELMYEVRGLGLAAAQVGLNIRLFVVTHSGEIADGRVYVNPEMTDMSGAVDREEGCLSLPEVYVPLRRAQACTIRATGLDGKTFEERAEDLRARAWQHEMDHLNGILIYDRMPPTAKITNRRLLKKLEDDFRRTRSSHGLNVS